MIPPIYKLPDDYHPGWCAICGSVLDDPLWPTMTEAERRESDEQDGKDPDGYRCPSCGRLCKPTDVIVESWTCPKCGGVHEPTTDGGCTGCSTAPVDFTQWGEGAPK